MKARHALSVLLLLFFATPFASANSAGNYGLGGRYTVSTRLLAGPGTLQTMVRDNQKGQNSGWVDVTTKPGGDGMDALGSPAFPVCGQMMKWKNGKLIRSTENGWCILRKNKNKKGTVQHKAYGMVTGNEISSLPTRDVN